MARRKLQEFQEKFQDYLELLKTVEYTRLNRVYKNIGNLLTSAVNELGKDISELRRSELNRFVASVSTKQKAMLDKMVASHRDELEKFAGYSYEIEASLLAANTGASIVHLAKSRAIFQAAFERPLGATGEMLETFIGDLSSTQVKTVEKLLRKAYVNGLTSSEVVRILRGTRAKAYADGLMSRLGKQTKTVVRTGMQHINNSARQMVWAENADIVEGYQWLSTLDDRTSDICIELDLQIFKIGEGPIPPAHPNCRSTTIAVLDKAFDILDEGATRSSADGYVPLNTKYADWKAMHDQSKSQFPGIEGLFDPTSREHAEIYKALPTPFTIPPEAQKILDRMDFIGNIDLTRVNYGAAIQFPSDPDGLAILNSAADGLIEMHKRFPVEGKLNLENMMHTQATAAYMDNGSNRLAFNVNFFSPEQWARWLKPVDPIVAMFRDLGVGVNEPLPTATIDEVLAGIPMMKQSLAQSFIDSIVDEVLRERASVLAEVEMNISNTPKKTMYHEYGHHLTRMLRLKAMGKRAFKTDYRGLISVYGSSNYAELMAESISLYMQGDESQYWRIHPEVLAKLRKIDQLPNLPFELTP